MPNFSDLNLSELLKGPISPIARQGLLMALGVFILDQITKAYVLYGLGLNLYERVTILPFFNITLVHNIGVSFGLLAAEGIGRWLLVLFSVIVSIGLFSWLKKSDNRFLSLALGLIIGGALGNALDRSLYGYVVDFLDFSELHFPWVFNVADSAITIGVILLFTQQFFTPSQPDQTN
jgi:signal peptidase II